MKFGFHIMFKCWKIFWFFLIIKKCKKYSYLTGHIKTGNSQYCPVSCNLLTPGIMYYYDGLLRWPWVLGEESSLASSKSVCVLAGDHSSSVSLFYGCTLVILHFSACSDILHIQVDTASPLLPVSEDPSFNLSMDPICSHHSRFFCRP